MNVARSTNSAIVVAVVTYRRPVQLKRCLDSLVLLDSVPGWGRDVIVVDNDPQGSAGSVAQAHRNGSNLAVTYEIEPTPGIAAARNRCIAMAGARDSLAFLDDDEIADPSWLAELRLAQVRFDADLLGGPVESQFDRPPPRWALDSGSFTRPTRPAGLTERSLATGNMLIRLATMTDLGELFDNRYGLSGGSDEELSVRARLAGKRLAWAPTAIVRERVQTERVRRRWVLKRRFRVGSVHARVCLQHETVSGRTDIYRLAARTAGAAALRYPGRLLRREPAAFFRTLRVSVRALGMIAGASDFTFVEYRRAR